jgi:hypothetical protein
MILRAMFILASPHIPDGTLQALGLMWLYPIVGIVALTALALISRRKWRRAAMRTAKSGLVPSVLVIGLTVSIFFEKGELGDTARGTWWVLWVACAPLVISVAVLVFCRRSVRKDPDDTLP